jgi:hypothetical protein
LRQAQAICLPGLYVIEHFCGSGVPELSFCHELDIRICSSEYYASVSRALDIADCPHLADRQYLADCMYLPVQRAERMSGDQPC